VSWSTDPWTFYSLLGEPAPDSVEEQPIDLGKA